MPESTSSITVVSNVGSGSIRKINLESDLTVGDVINRILGLDSGSVTARVNNRQAGPETVLNAGDQVSVAPIKASGATV